MRTRPAAGGVALACALLAFGAPGSAAAAPSAGPVRIVSPARDAFYTGKVVKVRVRRTARARVVAWLDGRRVRLRSRRGALVARVRRSRLRAGTHRFNVVATIRGRAFRRHVRFGTAGRRRPALLRVATAGRSGRPLAVSARLAKREARLIASLNGRRVEGLFERPGVRRRRASLSASDGLRHGRNTLRVTAYLGNGDYATVVRRITRRRDRPLAGAGVDRPAVARRALVLHGGRSRAAHGGKLSYRWAIVRAPHGSHARLGRARSRRPRLRPDRPGTYRVRLTVRERRRARTAVAVAGAAASASDTVTLSVQPTADPIGVLLDTYDNSGGTEAIVVGDQRYTEFPTGGGYQVLVLDRTGAQGGTLGLLANEAVAFGSESQIAGVWQPYASQSPLVIVTASANAPQSATGAFNQAIGQLGADPVWSVGFGASVVAIPSGQAYVYGPGGVEQSFSGMTGYLTKDTTTQSALTSSYVFAPSEYIPFTLDGPNASFEITVGCNPEQTTFCTRVPITGAPSPGFVLVLLNPWTLELESTSTYGVDSLSLNQLASDLQNVASNPTRLYILKTVGEPAPNDPAWGQVSELIQQLGGNQHTFNTFNPPNQPTGPNDYALVGSTGNITLTGFTTQAEDYTGPVASAPLTPSGVLTRQPGNWQFAPTLSDPLGTVDYSLSEIAYQSPHERFPYSSGPYAAAEADIAEGLSCPSGPPCEPWPDVRSQYWIQADVPGGQPTNWSALVSQLDGLQYPRGASYSLQQWKSLKGALAAEFPLVDNVNKLIVGLWSPYGSTDSVVQADLQTIADDIAELLVVQANTNAQVLATIGDIFDALGGIPVIGPVFGAEGSALNIASVWTASTNGALELLQVEITAAGIDQTLAAMQSDAEIGFARLQALLVSDPAKLRAASDLSDNFEDWSPGSDDFDAASKMLALVGRRTIWSALVKSVTNGTCTPPFAQPSFEDVYGWQGSPGQVTPAQRTVSVDPGLSSEVVSGLFDQPTWATGDVNAGYLPEDFFFGSPFRLYPACP